MIEEEIQTKDIKKCLICGTEFEGEKSTCSRSCQQKLAYKNRPAAKRNKGRPKKVVPELTEKERNSLGGEVACKKCGKMFFIPWPGSQWVYRDKNKAPVCSWSCMRK